MRRMHGVKDNALTRGGLPPGFERGQELHLEENPLREERLRRQESAEVIVPVEKKQAGKDRTQKKRSPCPHAEDAETAAKRR